MDKTKNKQEQHFFGSGWSFPVTFSEGNYMLNLTEYEKNVNQSIHVILQTKKGERYLEPQFGSGLQQFFFRKMDETLKAEIMEAVSYSLLINEPRISVEKIKVSFEETRPGQVDIEINYRFNETNTRHNYVFPFHMKEGTNLK